MTEQSNSANEHIWRYFELHAQQRMTVFNFYIAITGLLAAGIGFTLQQGGHYIIFSSLMGIFISFISFVFWKLDARVSMLIKNSELALKELEDKLPNPQYRIITKDINCNETNTSLMSIWTYGRCFRMAFLIVGISGIVLAIIPFLINFSTK
ncbi:RipA family octameric membrane protein [Hafnia paralvei]|uniref:RipA family octameric membrane protein n=1 Tax=Hafnia paralvei TaxID=546367 RepID=UPI00266B767A|nr:hypothetical protein [Hafnia paralvei]